jgi:hypothetical protein
VLLCEADVDDESVNANRSTAVSDVPVFVRVGVIYLLVLFSFCLLVRLSVCLLFIIASSIWCTEVVVNVCMNGCVCVCVCVGVGGGGGFTHGIFDRPVHVPRYVPFNSVWFSQPLGAAEAYARYAPNEYRSAPSMLLRS